LRAGRAGRNAARSAGKRADHVDGAAVMRLRVLQLAVAVAAVDDEKPLADVLPSDRQRFTRPKPGVAEQLDHYAIAKLHPPDSSLDLQRRQNAWPRDSNGDALHATARVSGQLATRDGGTQSG